MSANLSNFVWYELMTSDTKAAESFYRKVIGWDTKDAGMTDRSYTILSAGATMIGGLMALPPEAHAVGSRPSWIGYIGVDDVDAVAKRIQAQGGVVHRVPEDIPGIGRFAVVADPQDAVFVLFHGAGEAPAALTVPDQPGHVGWCELHAGDGASAFAFYADLFGWTKAEAMDMGPMGIYQLFAAGATTIGGMMTKTPETPAPFWLYYFNVDAIDAAVARVTQDGGQILMGPHEVPGGSWIVQCRDPQGALFALVAPKR